MFRNDARVRGRRERSREGDAWGRAPRGTSDPDPKTWRRRDARSALKRGVVRANALFETIKIDD